MDDGPEIMDFAQRKEGNMGISAPLAQDPGQVCEKMVPRRLLRSHGRHRERTWRDVIADMPVEDALEHLKWFLEEITWAPAHGRRPLPGIQLTPQEAKVLYCLDRANGKMVSIPALLAAATDNRDDGDTPGEKLVSVLICKMRKKLKGTGVTIETFWSEGYGLSCAPGVRLDWGARD